MADAESETVRMRWPLKHDVFGVGVSGTTYEELAGCVLEAAARRLPSIVDHMPVHGLVEAVQDPSLRRASDAFNVVAPDGQPVRWALNALHHLTLPDRVYGPEFMKRLCGRCAESGLGVYLYGGSSLAVTRLKARLEEASPGLRVVGYESPPFRPLSVEEDLATTTRINESRAGIVFLGLGCPKQEVFAYQHRKSIEAVQICVGAAFDFLSGEKPMAPKWMQDRGLEWLFRLWNEPRRLHRRYLRTNSVFLLLLVRALLEKKGLRLR